MTTDIFKGLIMLNKTRYKALQHMRKRNNSLSEHSWSSCNPKGTCPPFFSLFAFLCEHYMLGFFFRVQTLHVTFLWCLLSGCVMFPIFLYSLWSFSTLTPLTLTNYLLKWDFWIKSANAPQGPFF